MQCAAFVAVSLDGFLARSDGRLDWLSLVEEQGEDYGYRRFVESVDAVVLGRKTYEVALGFPEWPYRRKRCVVLTRGARSSLHGERFEKGPVTEIVETLDAAGARRVYVDGGTVVQQFLAADLIADLTVSIVPVLLGDGVRLFGPTGRDVRLRLIGRRAFASGLVRLEYRVLGHESDSAA